MEAYITVCKIDSQWGFAVCLMKLKQGLCINLERWDGEGDGREVQEGGDICIPMYGETVETMSDFILGGSKITADGDCSHEIKRHSLEEKL